MSPGILVSSERDSEIFELLTKGRDLATQLGLSISALVFGNVDDKKAQKYFEYGAHEITAIPNIDPSSLDAETYTHALFEVTKDNGPDILLISSSKLGKETAGRIAQKLQAGCATDAIGLSTKASALVIERSSLGGNAAQSRLLRILLEV